MHELGIMAQVVSIVEQTMAANGLTKVETVVLQVGELAEVVPEYLYECFPAVCYKTSLEGMQLEIETIPGLALCRACEKQFNVVLHEGKCPDCGGADLELISGREFLIKYIEAC